MLYLQEVRMEIKPFSCPLKVVLLWNLEPHEFRIVSMVMFGKSNIQIALLQNYQPDAIQNNLTNIYKKLLIFEGKGVQKRENLKEWYRDQYEELILPYLDEFPDDTEFKEWIRIPFVWETDVPEKCRERYMECIRTKKNE